jgi:hypothetical protein
MLDNKSANDYGKQALMRIEDLEARLNRQILRNNTTSVVLAGKPNVLMDNRTVQLGRVGCSSAKLSIIFKYTGDVVQLLINNLVAIGNATAGIAFASVNIPVNQSVDISIKGAGLFESFEIYLTGDGIWVDSYGKFCCDYREQSGIVAVVDGGNIYVTPIDNQDILAEQLLMIGNSVDVCVSTNGDNICAVDHLGNIWLMQLRNGLNVGKLIYLGNGADMVALHCNGQDMYIAVLQSGKVRLGKLGNGSVLGWTNVDYDRVRAINWVKQSNEYMLILTFGDRRNIVLRGLDCIDTSIVVNVYATATCQ